MCDSTWAKRSGCDSSMPQKRQYKILYKTITYKIQYKTIKPYKNNTNNKTKGEEEQ